MGNPLEHFSPATCNEISAEVCSEQLASRLAELASRLAELVKKIFQRSNVIWKWVMFPALLDVLVS